MSNIVATALTLLVASSVLAWFEAFGWIRKKDGQVEQPVANEMQQQMNAIVQWCLANKVPCRIILLKPRQKGASTFSTAILAWWIRKFSTSACIIGGEYSQVANLWRILRLYLERDVFRWGVGTECNDEEIKCSNGSRVVKETAKDSDAGRSGTIQALICTEVARWKEGLVVSATAVLGGILNCVPYLPQTIVILESTANGMAGPFYERWQGAVSFEDFKAGKRGNGFIKVFSPWFIFEDSHDRLSEGEESALRNSLTAEERDEMERWGLSLGQVSYRRRMIANECGGDPELFKQEYPSDEVTAFLASGRMAFSPGGIAASERIGRRMVPRPCVFDRMRDGRLVFRQVAELESWATVWESPMVGRRYGVIADPSTGVTQAGGDDPDRHSVIVMRAGQYVAGAGWLPPALVARVRAPCYVDMDLLADWIDRLSLYYGRCIVVPEINNSGLALVEALRPYNVPIYEREQYSVRESTKRKVKGWQTTEPVRRFLVETAQRAIRETEQGTDGEGVIIPCPHVIGECRKFIIAENGKAIAAPGWHDDDVLTLGIGLCTQASFTVYSEAVLVRPVPRDLRGYMGEGQGGRGSVGRSQYS